MNKPLPMIERHLVMFVKLILTTILIVFLLPFIITGGLLCLIGVAANLAGLSPQ